MDVKLGDVYIRKSDGRIYRVKKIDNNMIVLESKEPNQLALTDIFGLEKAYTKKEEHAPFHHPLSPNPKESEIKMPKTCVYPLEVAPGLATGRICGDFHK